ncbi:NAD(P)-dependent dehydrogenase, short-chain alcohol dehydrogenase family [Amycolatopsis arida]|uniref:NAD(P)-dependent dehydrogenase, short-chain alcohol dehydrogenase family n=1 Tax=Amycolatopsis arida TaxID=587909 RepID=A0A1I5LBP4_9PSEU|nr:SDR family oxidoreductase [Amycolatopsis arida]TDX93660.1 NAD(P)-dependent dehydrogenase (short-subunit alcohol dehydrogenase family) [Amycolatopsis arida]SFO94603.1 NAD(P)-dependent dehydrogenase, short-chain alcohol dehydrogenase family [Amycolatopsis arida]
MLLENKTAVVYGAGGSIGSALAKGFAAEGARCVLVGRTPGTLDAVAEEIRAAGGHAETAVLDALDEAAVNDHADTVAARTGSLDISVNVITQDAIFTPLADMPVAEFARAIEKVAASQLLTTKAAARHMVKQESGVILFFGGSDHNQKQPGLGTVQIGMDVVESLRRQWACELGEHGVRVVTLLTGGIPESFPDMPEMEPQKQAIADATLLRRAATLADVGQVAAFVASDRARTMTSTQVNISCGAHGD